MKVMVVLLLAAGAFAAFVVGTGRWEVPPRWNPWAPLDPTDAPNLLTRFKLDRLSTDPAACLVALDRTGFRYRSLPDRVNGEGCGLRDAVQVESMNLASSPPFALACPAAVSLALWERHVLQPAAAVQFGQRVGRLQHAGSYACRNVVGNGEGRARSRHATAEALDVTGFVLDDGRRIDVRRDWTRDGAASRFLREVHDGACRWFDVVLGPDYNAAHATHFHFDRGPMRACR